MKATTKTIVLTKKGTINSNIVSAIVNTKKEGNKLYPNTWQRNSRSFKLRSYEDTLVNILKAQGYKYELGNDSEKGGQEGVYIKVSKVAMNFLISLTK